MTTTITFALPKPPTKCSSFTNNCDGRGLYICWLTKTPHICDCGIDPMEIKKLEDEHAESVLNNYEKIQEMRNTK